MNHIKKLLNYTEKNKKFNQKRNTALLILIVLIIWGVNAQGISEILNDPMYREMIASDEGRKVYENEPLKALDSTTPDLVLDKGDEPMREEGFRSDSSLEQLIRDTFRGTGQEDIAVAVAKAESGLNPQAVGDGHLTFEKDGELMGMSCGVFQIRNLPGRPDCEEMKDPKKNVEYAKMMFDKAGWNPWSAWKNNSYQTYLK